MIGHSIKHKPNGMDQVFDLIRDLGSDDEAKKRAVERANQIQRLEELLGAKASAEAANKAIEAGRSRETAAKALLEKTQAECAQKVKETQDEARRAMSEIAQVRAAADSAKAEAERLLGSAKQGHALKEAELKKREEAAKRLEAETNTRLETDEKASKSLQKKVRELEGRLEAIRDVVNG